MGFTTCIANFIFCADITPSEVLTVSPSQFKSRVVVTHHLHIDETNEEVQALLEAEMWTVEECIRAIELYGTADVAFNHMMELKEKGVQLEDSQFPLLPVVKAHEIAGASLEKTRFVMLHYKNALLTPILSRAEDILFTVKKEYLTLKELGLVLRHLSLNFPGKLLFS